MEVVNDNERGDFECVTILPVAITDSLTLKH